MRVGNGLALGRLTDEHFVVVTESHNRRRSPVTLAVLQNLGLTAIHHGHTRIRGAEVDSNDACHVFVLKCGTKYRNNPKLF